MWNSNKLKLADEFTEPDYSLYEQQNKLELHHGTLTIKLQKEE